jgi:hypothetical protein
MYVYDPIKILNDELRDNLHVSRTASIVRSRAVLSGRDENYALLMLLFIFLS